MSLPIEVLSELLGSQTESSGHQTDSVFDTHLRELSSLPLLSLSIAHLILVLPRSLLELSG